MATDDPALAVLRELAAFRGQLAYHAREGGEFELTVRESDRGTVEIDASCKPALSEGRDFGVGRSLHTQNVLDGRGWYVGRELWFFPDHVIRGGRSLDGEYFLTATELCEALPRLVHELFAAIPPKGGE